MTGCGIIESSIMDYLFYPTMVVHINKHPFKTLQTNAATQSMVEGVSSMFPGVDRRGNSISKSKRKSNSGRKATAIATAKAKATAEAKAAGAA